MKSTSKKILTVILIAVAAIGAAIGGWFLYRSLTSKAATTPRTAVLSIDPVSGKFKSGEAFDADLKVDTGGGTIGTVNTKVHFDPKILTVTKVDETGSVFKTFSSKSINNEEGVISILAATTDVLGQKYGYTTKDGEKPGQMLKISFKVKAGSGVNTTTNVDYDKVTYVNTLADNPGDPSYNILKETKGAVYTIGEGGGEEPGEIPAPTNLKAKAGDAQVNLAWEYEKEYANLQFNIYRKKDTHAEYKKLATTTEKAYLDKAVTNGVTYFYHVKAEVNNKESEPSNAVSATPKGEGGEEGINPPTNLQAKAGDARVNLTWDYAEVAAVEFNVYRKTTGDYDKLTTVSEKNYLDLKVQNGNTYHYYVTALISSKESKPSNIVSATPTSGGEGNVLYADIAHNDGEGNAVYGRDNKVDYFDYAFLMNVVWGKDPSNWQNPNVDYAKLDDNGDVVLGSDGKVNYAEYAYMLNVEWGKTIQ